MCALHLAALLSASAAAQTNATQINQVRDWELIRDVDAITDAVTILGRSRVAAPIRLLAMCSEGRPLIAVGHPAMVGDVGRVQVSFRFDARPGVGPYTATLTSARTGSRLTPDVSDYGVREGRRARRMTVRVSDPAGPTTVTSVVSLDGFSGILDALDCVGTAAPPPPPPSGTVELPPFLIGGMEGLNARLVYPDFDRRAGVEGVVSSRFASS